MNTVWILLMVASVLFAFLNGRLDAFTKSIFEGAKSAVEVSLFLLGIVSLWLGITKIIEDSGLMDPRYADRHSPKFLTKHRNNSLTNESSN